MPKTVPTVGTKANCSRAKKRPSQPLGGTVTRGSDPEQVSGYGEPGGITVLPTGPPPPGAGPLPIGSVENVKPEDVFTAEDLNLSRKSVNPKSLNQQEYIQAIKNLDLVFGIGPAGTGKTYLAMAMALSFLQNKTVNRIILTRPAVEAGEKLGFLPGDMYQKINPYLRPLYDALFDLAESEQAKKLIEKGVIEIVPLAFMRGRTLSSSFIILDEAQNTTKEQMKMILTRAGLDSKMVVTADITQIDLAQPHKSGVLHAMRILSSLNGIATIHFNERDIFRHPLVQKIIKAYQKAEAKSRKK